MSPGQKIVAIGRLRIETVALFAVNSFARPLYDVALGPPRVLEESNHHVMAKDANAPKRF